MRAQLAVVLIQRMRRDVEAERLLLVTCSISFCGHSATGSRSGGSAGGARLLPNSPIWFCAASLSALLRELERVLDLREQRGARASPVKSNAPHLISASSTRRLTSWRADAQAEVGEVLERAAALAHRDDLLGALRADAANRAQAEADRRRPLTVNLTRL